MLRFTTQLHGLVNARKAEIDERGATAVEYALMVVLIALAIIAGATAFGSAVNGKFSSHATTVSGIH